MRGDTLLFENDKVVGVRTSTGEDIRSAVVISDIGVRETVNRLLPADCGHDDWIAGVNGLHPSIARSSLFLGFEGDVEKAGATRSNHWFWGTVGLKVPKPRRGNCSSSSRAELRKRR